MKSTSIKNLGINKAGVVPLDTDTESESEDSDEEVVEEVPVQDKIVVAQAQSLATIKADDVYKLAPSKMVNHWSGETSVVLRSTGRGRKLEKEMYKTCTVVEFNNRLYGLTVMSDAKGAKEQAEMAALKLGVAMGDQQDMEKATEALNPEQKRHLDILMKLRARTTSTHAGEADNATRLLKKKLGELSDVSEVKNLLDMTINVRR